jgi:hypothetical protein
VEAFDEVSYETPAPCGFILFDEPGAVSHNDNQRFLRSITRRLS